MKKVYGIILFTVITFGLVINSSAQDSFDTKKRTGGPVNTSSLNAKRINGSGRNANARANIQPAFVKKSQPLVKPSLQQPRTKVTYSNDTGLPSFVVSDRVNAGARAGLTKDARTSTVDYLRELSPVLQLEKAESDFSIVRITSNKTNQTTETRTGIQRSTRLRRGSNRTPQ